MIWDKGLFEENLSGRSTSDTDPLVRLSPSNLANVHPADRSIAESLNARGVSPATFDFAVSRETHSLILTLDGEGGIFKVHSAAPPAIDNSDANSELNKNEPGAEVGTLKDELTESEESDGALDESIKKATAELSQLKQQRTDRQKKRQWRSKAPSHHMLTDQKIKIDETVNKYSTSLGLAKNELEVIVLDDD